MKKFTGPDALLFASPDTPTTCSLFKAEGQAQIEAFLQRRGPAEASLDPRSPGHLLPLPDNRPEAATGSSALHDGFFLALLHKH